MVQGGAPKAGKLGGKVQILHLLWWDLQWLSVTNPITKIKGALNKGHFHFFAVFPINSQLPYLQWFIHKSFQQLRPAPGLHNNPEVGPKHKAEQLQDVFWRSTICDQYVSDGSYLHQPISEGMETQNQWVSSQQLWSVQKTLPRESPQTCCVWPWMFLPLFGRLQELRPQGKGTGGSFLQG